jgi:hypothetical protein
LDGRLLGCCGRLGGAVNANLLISQMAVPRNLLAACLGRYNPNLVLT